MPDHDLTPETAVTPDPEENVGSTPLTPAVYNFEPQHENKLSVGNVHLGAAALAVLFVGTVAAYLKWLAGVDVPPDVLIPTQTFAGAITGRIYPSD